MENLLPFIIKSSITLFVFYTYFYLFLRKSKKFQLNRIYLITSSLLSMILPFINFNNQEVRNSGVISVMLKEVSVFANYNILPETQHSFIFTNIYIIGVIFFIVLFLMKMTNLYSVIRNSKLVDNGIYTLVKVVEKNIAYSFFNYVFVSEDNEGERKIISHELVHVTHRHSFDVLIINFLLIVMWFNPIIYLYKKAIQANHEYIADKEVIKTYSASSYLYLLLTQCMGTSVPLTNSFTHSNLKKRIKMIKNQRNMRYTLVKYVSAFALPLAMVFAMSACNQGDVSGNLNKKASKLPVIEEIDKADKSLDSNNEVFVRVENMPKFYGGKDALVKYISKNLKYPVKAQKTGISGRVFVGFVVDKDGKVINVKILRHVDKDLDAEALRVVKGMPNWIPGTQKGQAVKVSYTVPINFALKE